jgi:hypothetical protein
MAGPCVPAEQYGVQRGPMLRVLGKTGPLRFPAVSNKSGVRRTETLEDRLERPDAGHKAIEYPVHATQGPVLHRDRRIFISESMSQ